MAKVQAKKAKVKAKVQIPSIGYITLGISFYCWIVILFRHPTVNEFFIHSYIMGVTSFLGVIFGHSIRKNNLSENGAFMLIFISGIISFIPYFVSLYSTPVELGVYLIHWLIPMMNWCLVTFLTPFIIEELEK